MPQNKRIDPFVKNICRRIAEIRKERGITQEKLAEMMNVAPREIQRWESIGGLSLKTLKRFSDALGCPATSFFEKPKSTYQDGTNRKSKI